MATTLVTLRLIYRGGPPVHWTGGAEAFGLQDKENRLLIGQLCPDGGAAFEISVAVNGLKGVPVFAGPFIHGAPAERFLYLSWCNAGGEYAQRFKLPLCAITQGQVDQALAYGLPITGTLVVEEQRATKTGANIGGTRPVDWSVDSLPDGP